MRNENLVAACLKYKDYPVVVAGESMADLCGFTQTEGRIRFCGDPKYENEGLYHIGPLSDGIVGRSHMRSGGALKFANAVETLLSLLLFDCSQWGYKGLCKAIRILGPDVDWWTPVKELGLEGILFEKLREAISLWEDDESILGVARYRLTYGGQFGNFGGDL